MFMLWKRGRSIATVFFPDKYFFQEKNEARKKISFVHVAMR
jgi:hypothetical protein